MSAVKTLVMVIASVAAGISLWNGLSDDKQVAPTRIEVVKEYVIAPPMTQYRDPASFASIPTAKPTAAQPQAPGARRQDKRAGAC